MIESVALGLSALQEHLIDYAGMFPPAGLSRDAALANYERYRSGKHAWMLRWLVVHRAELNQLPAGLHSSLSVLSDADEPRAAAIEAKRVLQTSRPTYCEVPLEELDRVKEAGCFAKIRTGGLELKAIPSVEDVAAFILACAKRRLPFKATAGLHHPLRSEQALTYKADAPRAIMHGFLNVFVAAAFAWHGKRPIEPILAEIDARAFHFDDCIHWRDWSLTADQVREARQQFAHSFGSCSFEEPVRDLEALGLL